MLLCTRCEAIVVAPGRCPECGRRVAVPPEEPVQAALLEPGEERGGFRIEALVKDHGYRRVYLAAPVDAAADTPRVILKELCPRGSSKRRRGVALEHTREAEVLARCDHPAIPRLVAAFEAQGRRYLAIERRPGRTLWSAWRRRRRRPFAVDKARAVITSLTEALVYLHHELSPSVFHRDLSPGNVLIAPGEAHRVSVIDFATAASPGEPAVRLFTTGFDPPERHFTRRESGYSDLYAVGALLHFLLSGRDPSKFPPFQPPPLSRLVPGRVPPELERICLWLVQSDPGRRLCRADDLLVLLRGGQQPLPTLEELRRGIDDADALSDRYLAKAAGEHRRPGEALTLARWLLASGRLDGAKRVLLDALETLRLDDEVAHRRGAEQVLALLADHYLLAGDARRALAVTGEAIALKPGLPLLAMVRARALRGGGQPLEAADVVAAALAEEDGAHGRQAGELLTLQAELHLDAGRAAEAERAAAQALDVEPRSFAAARVLHRAAVHPSRIPDLTAALEASGAHGEAADEALQVAIDLGLAELAAGHEERGRERLLDALERERGDDHGPPSEGSLAARLRLSRWRMRALAEDDGRLEDALALAERAAARYPSAPFFLYYAGLLCHLLERPSEALERFDRLRALAEQARPDGEADAHLTGARSELWRGRALEALERREEAREAYRCAVRAAPGLTAAREALAGLDDATPQGSRTQ